MVWYCCVVVWQFLAALCCYLCHYLLCGHCYDLSLLFGLLHCVNFLVTVVSSILGSHGYCPCYKVPQRSSMTSNMESVLCYGYPFYFFNKFVIFLQSSVVAHFVDASVACLVQVLLDKECRTITGFCRLLRKEWFGEGYGSFQFF